MSFSWKYLWQSAGIMVSDYLICIRKWWCLLLGNYELVTDFSSYCHSLVTFFSFLKLQRNLGWKGKRKRYFLTQFLFLEFMTIFG